MTTWSKSSWAIATVSGPVWVQPGMADYSLGLALGYGREKAGRVGTGVGFNAYALRTPDDQDFAVGATVRKLDETFTLACTQDHWSMEGRPIVREANLDQFREHPDFAQEDGHGRSRRSSQPLYPNPLDEAKKNGAAPVGHVDRPELLRRLRHLRASPARARTTFRSSARIRSAAAAKCTGCALTAITPQTRSKDALPRLVQDGQAQQFEEWIDDPQSVDAADALPALRSGAVRKRLPGQRHRRTTRKV